MRTLIKNAVVYSGGNFIRSDVYIVDSVIHSLGISLSHFKAERVFDFKNRYYLFPGLVDVHVHLRQPGFSYKETILTGTRAAARAGYTAVCPMPNLNPVPDSPENLKAELDIIRKDAVIDVLPFASITKGRRGCGECVDFSSLAGLAVGFSDDGTGVQEESVMRAAMKSCAAAGGIISAHCEVNELLSPVRNAVMVNHTKISAGVCKVDYDNGYSIYVNYNTDAANVQGTEIGAMDAVCIKGENSGE